MPAADEIPVKESWRTFIAIPLPPHIQSALADLQATFPRRHADSVRWVRPDSIHLTLRFIGATDRGLVPGIAEQLAGAASATGRFQLGLDAPGTFPARGRPRVLWVGLAGETRRLERLRSRLEGALARIGVDPESRPFEPHLTAGRIKNEAGAPDAFRAAEAFRRLTPAASSTPFTVDRLTLFRSHLDQTGARYEVLSEALLG